MAINELELQVIGMLINCDQNRQNILNLLEKYSFSVFNKLVVEAIKQMGKDNLPIDSVSLVCFIEEKNKGMLKHELYKATSIVYDSSINFVTSANYKYYCKKLLEYQLNELIKNAESLEDMQDIKLLQDFIVNTGTKEDFSHIGEDNNDLTHYFDTMETVIKTGYRAIDDVTKGFYNGEFIIIAAATGAGKTAFALNICKNMANDNKNILFISLEMSKRELRKRLNCAELKINSLKIRGHELSAQLDSENKTEMSRYFDNMDDSINKLPIYVNNEFNINIPKIEAYAKQLKENNTLDVIIIDYLTLLTTHERFSSKREEVCYLTRALKILARTINVPVICLSQLSRATDARQNKRPILSDLKESSSIEQDADIVMFLYRDDYYFPESEKKDILEVAISKARDCATGVAELNFLKQYQLILDRKRY